MHLCIYESLHLCSYASMHLCIYISRPKHHAKQTNSYTKTCLKTIQNCPKNHPKIDQHWSKNRPTWVQKSTKIGPKALLESSGGHLGPKSKKSAFDPPSSPPSWEPSWSPKSSKIGSKSDPKCDHFLDWFGESFLKRFGANLGPSWLPKPSQNEAKLATKSIQVGVLIRDLFSEGCCMDFCRFL